MGDCIAAISTPPGEGGIAVIRVSGESAPEIVDKVFMSRSGKKLHEFKTHSLNLGYIRDENGTLIDEVLVSRMDAPHSYTGENVVEINCHGGAVATRRCLELVINAGARLAHPGEFTKRAFLNGRLDMVQAEAVIEIIRARSEKALALSTRNLRGALSKTLQQVEEELIFINSRIEGSIDFPEEVGEPDWLELEERLQAVEGRLQKLAAGSKRARVYRDGVRVVIAGKPNVGKSSLLNVLAQKERAIVTEIPGTTRDLIEDLIYIKGIPVWVTDTAGIRETRDVIESMGVEKTRTALAEADIVVFVVDASTGIQVEDLEIMQQIEDKRKLVVINKTDIQDRSLSAEEVRNIFSGINLVEISALEETGIEELESALEKMIVGKKDPEEAEPEIMTNLRQERAIEAALGHVQDAIDGVKKRQPIDGIAVDTWGAVSWIEEITGKAIRTDVMERIFADFCIGK
ncbi:MAG: tRNA uridine-5-carboxymethylaminomethyl(34) synthesis GTPase MnmE [Syntrophomonadaceae bacterium]|nr:tRNA uridine-5-carboxymethylaminomethyl(34) synthesis GTPase MnmE [Syntrophomonadaceae bacterium]